jgi:hypothetical protein
MGTYAWRGNNAAALRRGCTYHHAWAEVKMLELYNVSKKDDFFIGGDRRKSEMMLPRGMYK